MNATFSQNNKAARPNAPRHTYRKCIPAIATALLVSLITFGLWPKPVPVETALVVRGQFRYTINEEGRTRIRHKYLVTAPVTGQLRRITLDPGDPVEAGRTVLAMIDPVAPMPLDARTRAAAEAKRAAAAANVEKSRVTYQFTQTELARFEKLFNEGAIAIQDLDAARTRAEQAARELAAAESTLKQVEAELAQFPELPTNPTNQTEHVPIEVVAPANGRVLRVFEQSARVVTAGTPLLEIGDPTDLEVVIEVLSRDGAMLEPGTPVLLEQWGGNTPLEAKVRLVEPAAFTKVSALGVEEQRVNVVADLVTPPEQRRGLGDGFRVEAKIIVWEGKDVLKAPAGAFFRRGDQWHVFVVVNNRAELRNVKTGRSNGIETHILEGLTEGETVVVYPGDRVRPGKRVRQIKI